MIAETTLFCLFSLYFTLTKTKLCHWETLVHYHKNQCFPRNTGHHEIYCVVAGSNGSFLPVNKLWWRRPSIQSNSMLCHMTGRLIGYVKMRKTVKSEKCSYENFRKKCTIETYCLFCVQYVTRHLVEVEIWFYLTFCFWKLSYSEEWRLSFAC